MYEQPTNAAQESAYVQDRGHILRTLEASIHIALLILLSVACLWILLPFLPLLVWGLIIAVAGYPAYRTLQRILGGREGLAAVIFVFILLGLLILPVILLARTLIDGVHILTAHLSNETLTIPPPPSKIGSWPIIGVPLTALWTTASTNLPAVLQRFTPQIRGIVSGLLATSAGLGLAVLQFALSILIAGVLLAHSRAGSHLTNSLFSRLFGDKGSEYEALVGATIRSVVTGILAVALLQSILAGMGFLVAGLRGASLWTMIFFIAAVLQAGVVVLIPAGIYGFMTLGTVKATLFLIWCAFVGLMDNVLKPLLLGRGVSVPIAVVFLGVIGGFLAMGIIGLFVGAIILSVGYKLFLAWVGSSL